jgi:hypothetical protein
MTDEQTVEELRSLLASYDALIARLKARRERLRQQLFQANYGDRF